MNNMRLCVQWRRGLFWNGGVVGSGAGVAARLGQSRASRFAWCAEVAELHCGDSLIVCVLEELKFDFPHKGIPEIES